MYVQKAGCTFIYNVYMKISDKVKNLSGLQIDSKDFIWSPSKVQVESK